MSWYLDNVRIFVQKISDNAKQIIARLQPLDDLTVYHIFGRESLVKKISAFIVGESDKNALINMTRDHALHGLTFPGGTVISGYVNEVSFDRLNVVCQTLRPDLYPNDAVYSVEIEFYKEE